jgi:hypothetical protein
LVLDEPRAFLLASGYRHLELRRHVGIDRKVSRFLALRGATRQIDPSRLEVDALTANLPQFSLAGAGVVRNHQRNAGIETIVDVAALHCSTVRLRIGYLEFISA